MLKNNANHDFICRLSKISPRGNGRYVHYSKEREKVVPSAEVVLRRDRCDEETHGDLRREHHNGKRLRTISSNG